MGFLDRVGKIASGVGGAVWAPFGLVKDLAVGAFTDDDEFDGFVGTIYGATVKRGGRLFGAAMGPEEGLGALFGAVPEVARQPVRAVTDPLLEGLETVGREGIREPLTAAVTAASMADAGKGFDLSEGYRIAQNRSLGQAVALAFLTEDITDEAEVAEAMGSDWYESISGTMDAAARLLLEPDTVLGSGVTAARKAGAGSRATQALGALPGTGALVEKGVFGRTIRTGKDVEAALAHPNLQVVNERILKLREEAGITSPRVYSKSVEELEQIAAGPAVRSEDLFEGYTEGLQAGSPGFQRETRGLTPDEAEEASQLAQTEGFAPPEKLDQFVHRDDAGNVDGIIAVALDGEGKPLFFHTAVRSDRQRQGIGSSLFKEAEKAGHDLEGISGRMGMSAEGAKFALARRAAEKAPDPAAVDRVAARIRDLMFHDHRDGAFISRVLAEADDLDEAWGALLGDRASMERLWVRQADVAAKISRLSGDQARIAEMKRMVGTIGPDQLPLELPDEIAAIERAQLDLEIDKLYDVESVLKHAEQANAMVRELPRLSASSERRAQFTRSAFFQGKGGAPLRVAFNMRPRSMIDLHDAAGDIQVTRILKKARLPVEEQDRLRGAYMAAADPSARARVLEEVEAQSIRALATRHNIKPEEIDKMVEIASRGRGNAANYIATKSRVYDGQGRSYINDVGEDGVVTKIYVPLAATQEFNHFLTPDLDAIEKVMARHGEDISRVGAAKAGAGEFMETYQRLWKPSVLIRVGWPLRVVGEEQIRIMSQIGALLTAGRTAAAGSRYAKDLGIEAVSNATQAIRRVPKSERVFGGLTKEQAAARRGLRLGKMNIRGVEVESAMGTAETFNDVYRQLNSAKGSMDAVTHTADDLRNGLRTQVMGEWQSLKPTDPGYAEGWTHAVNKQVGQDEMWRQFLEGKTIDEVREWIDTTKEGRAYLRRMKHWKGRIDDWLEVARDTADEYLPTPELRAAALEGKAKYADLEKAVPDAAGRPLVNGAIVADVQGRSRIGTALGKLRDETMRVMGTIPTDVLSRQPYFDHHYTQEVSRLIELADDQGMALTPELIKQYEAKARNFALGESKKLLYDLADESELSHMLRFVSPFYSAWQEVITRWTGIAVENPAFVARLHEVWRAPERMGIVSDENGNVLDGEGGAISPLGEKVEPGKDRYVNFKLLASDNAAGKVLFNDLTRHVPGVKIVESAKFNKKSANLIVQGAPGVGPIVQIPLNEIAKGAPEIEDSLRWALPFGATQSTLDMVLPATARRIKTRSEEGRLYSNQLMRIYFDMQVDYNLGKRADAPTYAEAKKKTDSFYNLRTVASFVSPVAPSFQSPYQPYIDAYRALKEKDPETADEKFLTQFGEEFFPLTQSLSKSVDGVPPTLEGAAARERYADLVERNPELGGLIIGAEGAGEFSSAVYQSQLQKPVAPGSSDKQRQAFSFEEARAKPNERLGWAEYSKAMDIIDAERMNRGLPNLQVRAATDLADLKRGIIESLAKKYPEWFEKFSVTDRNAWNRKIEGMREIAADERLSGRPEIQMLGQYLKARDQVIDILAARKAAGGASTINAAGNLDIKGVWDQITAQMGNNPAFFSLWTRYLERDPLELESRRS